MDWDVFFGTLAAIAILACFCVGGYWALWFVRWSCVAVSDQFGQGWAIALGCAYASVALATVLAIECEQ